MIRMVWQLENRNHIRKAYEKFPEFLADSSKRQLEFIILDSKFSNDFNDGIKKMIKELKNDGKGEVAEVAVFFNTKGEVAVIDAGILGNYVSDRFTNLIESYYGGVKINEIVRKVLNGTEKAVKDFLVLSQMVVYRCLREIYTEIACRKETIERYKHSYFLGNYDEVDLPIVLISLLILEDVCKYLGIKREMLINCFNEIVSKRYSNNS